MKNRRPSKERAGKVVSVLGKRGGNEREETIDVAAPGHGGDSKQNKKACAATVGVEGKEVSKEATRPGAPGQLVDAEEGAHQEP